MMLQVHSLSSRGRYRESFDFFWNMGAELSLKNLVPRFVGLTATLRPEDVADVLKRQSIQSAVVFRVSCYREELNFQFNTLMTEHSTVRTAVSLAISRANQTKVLIYGTTVKICEMIGDLLRIEFKG